ncbi:YesN/AraC family two-component response regulator [Virgibacillus halotolerans]|nr:YesN/AraC family two-component response regulator [Virgibacillus halotolerans]
MKSKLLYKYIISYLLIFLIPFLIMSGIIYYNSVSSLRQQIEQSNLSKLEQVKKITDERMNVLETLAARISYDPRLTPYMMSQDYTSGEAIEELKKYKANSPIIDEIFVYYHHDNTLYSSSGSYSIDALLQKKYRFNNWEKEQIERDLHSKLPLVKPAENVIVNNNNDKRVIAYLFPIAPNNPSPYGTVMYFIEEAEIKDLIEDILGEFDGNAYILNGNDEQVAATIHDEEISDEQVASLVNDNKGIDNLDINGKNYSHASVTSDVSGWTFTTIMNTDQFFEKLEQTKRLIIMMLLALFILGFSIAVLLGRRQYKPIRNLFKIISSRHINGYESENELETIQNTVSNVFKDYQTINEAMYLQKPFARDQLLVRLLKGDIKDNQEIETLLDALNVQMRDGPFFVAIVYFESGTFKETNITARDKVFETLSRISLPEVTAYGIDLLYNDAIALVVSIDQGKDNTDKQRHVAISGIQQYIHHKLLMNPTIGVGTLCNEKKLINRSYIEALAAMEYKSINPQGSIIYFDDISLQPERALGYPKEEQIKLVQSLKQGDQIVAEETLRNMFTMLATKNLSIQVSKLIYFDIINTIVKTVTELGLDGYIHNFKQIVDFNSTEQLQAQLQTVIIGVCKAVSDKKESHNDRLRKDIIAYIKQNYDLYELSLEKIAVEFQLSISYISRFIKDQTGVTFTQYLQDLRIAHVKKQLTESDQSIKQIVMEVGYKDVANFTRKFKKIVGITPGQYRTLHK